MKCLNILDRIRGHIYKYNYSSKESSVSTHICKFPSRYNLAYSSGSATASEVNAQSDPGVVFKFFLLPNNQCGAYSLHWYKHQCCSFVDCILQILFSSYLISLSFNQSFVTKIRSISISSPCHFYFVLYCFILFSWPSLPLRSAQSRCPLDILWSLLCTLVFALIRVRKHWWDDITQGKQ